MIAIDTSALIAIMTGEVDAATLASRLDDAKSVIIGMPSVLEARIVMFRRIGPDAVDVVDQTLTDLNILPVDFTAAHFAAATDAFDRYGKGRHPASLNYGDCMAYAVARVANCPLLYKGDDFAQTDLRAAL